MKNCLLFFAIFYANFSFAQLNDTFSDSNFTNTPSWQGSVSSFTINTNGQLQTLPSDSAGIKYLVTSNSLATNTSWEFYVQLNFNPSSSNYARIYLISDVDDLTAPLHGYFVQIGEDGSADSFDLCRVQGSSITRLIDGKDGRASGSRVLAHIKVNRSSDGKWTLLSKLGGEAAYSSEGEVIDFSPTNTTSWFGVRCNYTKSRSGQFIFDDFRISSPVTPDDSLPDAPPGPAPSATIQPEEALISEVLFNPRGKGADFVEIYNNSSKILDLSGLSLASLKKDTLSGIQPVTKASLRFDPGSYMVLTTDPENVQKEYFTQNPDAFLLMPAMPALNNDEGDVILLSDSIRVDEFHYSEKMHLPLIKNPDGVSLERVSFTKAANAPGNFRSAAAAVGYATPGYKNSQMENSLLPPMRIYLESKTFSPDNDGFEDQLLIHYECTNPGWVANISVFNDRGLLILHLAQNLTLATEGSIAWDGRDQYTSIPSVGIYLIYVELFDLDGHIKTYRLPCALATRL